MNKDEALSKLELEEGATSSEINTQYQEFYNEFQMRITNAPTEHQRKLYQKKLEELAAAFEVLGGESSESNTQELPGISVSEVVETEKLAKSSAFNQAEMSKEKALQLLGLVEKFTVKELESAFRIKVSSCEKGRDNAINATIRNAYEEAIIECDYAHKLLKEYIFIAPPISKEERTIPKVSKDSSASKKKWVLPVSIVSGVIIVVILFFAFSKMNSNTDGIIDPALHDKYVSLKSQADLLAKQGNWQEALTKYEKAYSLVETPEVKDSLASMKNHLLLAAIKKDEVSDSNFESNNHVSSNKKSRSIEEVKTNPDVKKEPEKNWREKYDRVLNSLEGTSIVELNGKFGYVDEYGKAITKIKYEDWHSFYEGIACVKLNDKWGFINLKGTEITPFKYDDFKYTMSYKFNGGVAPVQLNDKWGFINKNGEEITKIKYDNVYGFYEGLCGVILNGKYGFINNKGIEIVPLKYDYVGSFNEGLATVELKKKATLYNKIGGYVNLKGEEVIALKYDHVTPFKEGKAFVVLNGKFIYIDKKGNCIKDCP